MLTRQRKQKPSLFLAVWATSPICVMCYMKFLPFWTFFPSPGLFHLWHCSSRFCWTLRVRICGKISEGIFLSDAAYGKEITLNIRTHTTLDIVLYGNIIYRDVDSLPEKNFRRTLHTGRLALKTLSGQWKVYWKFVYYVIKVSNDVCLVIVENELSKPKRHCESTHDSWLKLTHDKFITVKKADILCPWH